MKINFAPVHCFASSRSAYIPAGNAESTQQPLTTRTEKTMTKKHILRLLLVLTLAAMTLLPSPSLQQRAAASGPCEDFCYEDHMFCLQEGWLTPRECLAASQACYEACSQNR